MKRSPMKRGTKPLKRTALKRGTKELPRQKPLAKRSKRRAERGDVLDIPDAVDEALSRRSQGDCEALIPGVCPGGRHRAVERHHRLRRAHGGPHCLENLIHACGAAHGFIHANPAWSYEHGLLVPSWAGPPAEAWTRPEAAGLRVR